MYRTRREREGRNEIARQEGRAFASGWDLEYILRTCLRVESYGESEPPRGFSQAWPISSQAHSSFEVTIATERSPLPTPATFIYRIHRRAKKKRRCTLRAANMGSNETNLCVMHGIELLSHSPLPVAEQEFRVTTDTLGEGNMIALFAAGEACARLDSVFYMEIYIHEEFVRDPIEAPKRQG